MSAQLRPFEDNVLPWQSSDAVDDDATKLERSERASWIEDVKGTAERGAAFEELLRVVGRASWPNWDGEGANMISEATADRAIKFFAAIPLTFPLPEIEAEPEGRVAFEWYAGPRAVLTVSLGGQDAVAFAATLGSDGDYGRAVFRDKLPAIVVFLLRRLLAL